MTETRSPARPSTRASNESGNSRTTSGKRCNALFEKLVRRGFAAPYDCVHNRARLYHLHHKALYLAIRELASRHWRPASSRLWVERVMLLDALLPCADLDWLTTTSERRAWLASVTASTGHGEARGSSTTAVEDIRSGGFPRFPVGIDGGGRAVLVYLVTEPSTDRFRTFLHGNAALLRALASSPSFSPIPTIISFPWLPVAR